MALPKAIQRQADEAAAAQEAIAQEVAQQATQPETTDPSLMFPVNVPVPLREPQQPPAVSTPQVPPAEDWQHKYRSLQGIFAQKTGELQAQNKQYESQMTAMQRQLDALSQARTKEESKAQKVADPKDVENFGADLIEMVQRYAERVFQSMSDQFGDKANELDGRLKALEQQVTGVSERTTATTEQQFYATLNTLVPDWEPINQDPRWLTWLGEEDPVYGAPRQSALDHAHQTMNANRVASVFKAFKTAHPAKVRSSLEDQVAPNGASAPAPEAPTARPMLSSKFIEKFYNELAKGRYAGNEAEAARIEGEINLAAQESRIR